MELRESIESINENLKREYGTFEDGRPHFRIVWANDQYEKRWTDKTDEGFQLLNPEVRLLPKYKEIHFFEKYILERLVPVAPDSDVVGKTSYEPLWVFRDKNNNFLPPTFEMCKFPIDAILTAADPKYKGHAKYKDPSIDPQFRDNELKSMMEQLFGDANETIDALSYGYGVSYANLDGRPSKDDKTH